MYFTFSFVAAQAEDKEFVAFRYDMVEVENSLKGSFTPPSPCDNVWHIINDSLYPLKRHVFCERQLATLKS